MAKFLNTTQLSYWIERLIDETERELVIIVPYIKISQNILNRLNAANRRGVETVLVYRENHLNNIEKEKFKQLDNLNLLHHPNLHAKCYYNEKYLIIGSMNLYEYSEKNNREMGVLLHRCELNEDKNNSGYLGDSDDDKIFNDAIIEIRDIINSSELEKESRETIEDGFELDIIKTESQRALEHCKLLNKCFNNKVFEPRIGNKGYESYCSNYFDRINVSIDNRVVIEFDLEHKHLEKIYNSFSHNEFMYEGYKFYWNNYKGNAYIYPNSRHWLWKNVNSQKDEYMLFKDALAKFINDLKPLMVFR